MSEQQKGVTEDKPGNDKQWQFLTFTLKIDQAVPQNPVPCTHTKKQCEQLSGNLCSAAQ